MTTVTGNGSRYLFDRMYLENCDNLRMSRKMRGISNDNPFSLNVKAPENTRKEKILEKPNKIKDLALLDTKQPMAGRFSEIGEKILKLGDKYAKQITTGPWGEILMIGSEAQKAKFEKSFPTHPHQTLYRPGENHTHLHKAFAPPGYMTCSNMSYTGAPKA